MGYDTMDPAAPVPPGELVRRIEAKTKRKVTIETTQDAERLARCCPQSESILYQLPKEIRDMIFQYACTPSPHPQHPYKETAYYYRPGHTGRPKSYTSLLLTCRRVWLEAHALPMQQAEHRFWLSRGPYDTLPHADWAANTSNERTRYKSFLASLTDHSLAHVSHVTLYMQMVHAEPLRQPDKVAFFFPRESLERGFGPRVFCIGVRHSDFWDWEEGRPIGLDVGWVQAVLDSSALGHVEEFRLEIEVEEEHADELAPILRHLRGLEGQPKSKENMVSAFLDANHFVCRDDPTVWTWTRSSRLDDTDWPVYASKPMLRLRVTTLVWRNTPCAPAQPAQGFTASPEASPGPSPYRVRPHQRRGHPMLVARSRAQRQRLRTGGWMADMFPDKADVTWEKSVEAARLTADVERERFEEMVGVIEAERWRRRWAERGSLLRLVEGG